ncbi:hypothetical protein [Actinoplanes xinjiangensis]|uniref:hypothetical protein n=1 Tax=Actinoplanes xinjiangensis TaxID=512350 RepID=UPI0034157208
MADQWGGPPPDRRRPNVVLRFLSPAAGDQDGPPTTPVPGRGQPVAGRRSGASPGGSRLIGRATLARLRGGSPTARPPTFADEPTDALPVVPAPAGTRPDSAGRVVLIYEQQVRRPWRLWAFTAMLVSLTIGVVLGQTEASRTNAPRSAATVQGGPQPSASSPLPLTAPLGTAGQRRLEITGTATTLRIRTAQLGGSLFTITGFDPNVAPQVTEAGGGSVLALAPGAVVTTGAEVVLNARVAWTVRLTGATTELDLDARAGGLAAVEVASAVSRGVLHLSKPARPVPLTVTGPAGDLTVRTAAGAPVRVRVAKGAGLATVAGTTRRDVPAGTTLQETGWRSTRSGYDIRLAARVNTVLVERLPPQR